MKKILAGILVVLTLVCVLSVVGCRSKDPAKDPTTTATTTATTTTAATTTATTTTTTTKPTTTTTIPPTTSSQPNTTCNHYPTCNCGQWVNPRDSANWKKVVKNVFTSDKGGLQMKADGWKTFNTYNLSMVPAEYNNQGVTNAICVAVYDADPADVFANKTLADFEEVLMTDVDSLTPTTVCGYPAYYAVVEDAMYVYVINTPTHKYFINFMQAVGSPDVEPIGKSMMETVTIYK